MARFGVGDAAEGAALTDNADRPKHRRHVQHRDAEGDDHVVIEGGDAHAVGAYDAHTRLRRDAAHLKLCLVALIAGLGKSCAEYHHRLDAFFGALANPLQDQRGRQNNQRQIELALDIADRLVSRQALNFRRVRIDRINRASELVMFEVAHRPAADFVFVRRGAQNRNRFWPEHGL